MKLALKAIVTMMMVLFLASCGDNASNDTVEVLSIDDPVERLSFEVPTSEITYEDAPDVGTCYGGVISEQSKQEVVNFVNEIRARHNLPPTKYSDNLDDVVGAGAVLLDARDYIGHVAERTDACYSEDGALGIRRSNLARGFGNWANKILAFIHEPGEESEYNQVDALGHRRWMLYPDLPSIGYGQVGSFGVLYVVSGDLNVSNGVDYVAFPYLEYPDVLVNHSKWSISIAQKDDQLVNVAEATVKVTDSHGDPVTIYDMNHDNHCYGTCNVISWRVDYTLGEQYDVEVTVPDRISIRYYVNIQ